MSNLYQKFKIREQFAPLLFSQPRNQNQSITVFFFLAGLFFGGTLFFL